jgi:TolA-binding protein
MDAHSKKRLDDYKKSDPDVLHTEGLENTLIREATRLADRKKWQNLLTEEGIQRTETPVVELKKARTSIVRRLMPHALGLAAAIAFLVIFILRTDNSNSFDALISSHHYPAAEVRMGPHEDDLAAWKKGMAAYKNDQFSEATKQIKGILNPTSEQNFYLALSSIYQETPDYKTAIGLFQNFVIQSDAVYEEEARWFLAYSLYKSGKKEEAKTVLNEIIAKKGYNYEKAANILKKEF